MWCWRGGCRRLNGDGFSPFLLKDEVESKEMRRVLGSRKNYSMTGTVQVFDEKRGQGDLVME